MKNLRLMPLLFMANAAMGYEEPVYEVVQETDRYEIRDYAAYLVAETTVAGGFDRTGNVAFRRLAGYIFGSNTAPDTSGAEPVRMKMTVPVTRHRDGASDARSTVYRFVMERAYDHDSLPVADDDRVAIAEVPGGRFAVLRYRGRITEARFLKHVEVLRAALERDGVETLGEPMAAVYNGPWTPPFLRRNEVMIRLGPDQGAATSD